MTSKLRLTFNSDIHHPGFGSVAVDNLASGLIASLGDAAQSAFLLRSLFRVWVVQAKRMEGERLPDVFGRYHVSKDTVRFIPYFPFERGVQYCARFDPRPLGCTELGAMQKLEFSLPAEPSGSGTVTEVTQIFPSDDCLPENLLRFYLCFSDSMQRGRAEEQIALLDPDGRPVDDVLYRPPIELWDRKMKCLTILLDPGRLKRGVGPNRTLGPPLKAGLEYTLAVGSGMTDRSGHSLRETFCKRFGVVEAIREPIAIEEWKVVPPAAETRQPLVLLFPRPLDRALLTQTISISASTGEQPMEGRVVIDQCERRWSFTPASPWANGSCRVRVTSSLEDVCGNSVIAPFDRPMRSQGEFATEMSRALFFHPALGEASLASATARTRGSLRLTPPLRDRSDRCPGSG